jgi:RHS repeat-associated protein
MRLSQAAYRHPGQANLDQTFSYNAIDQLNGTTTYQGSQGYRYDTNGNRTQQLSGSTTYAYGYKTGNNRLQSVAGPVPKAYQYDAAGNITSDGQGLSYSYDDLGRLSGMSQRKQTGDAITTKAMGYTYDGQGQRYMKGGDAAGVIFYAYDETGRLLSEQDVGNVASQDTIWLDDLPVGVVKQGQLHYIHADHLHTPRAILDPQNRPRWRWDNADPFGVGQPDENPSGLGRFVYNPRFPGQVYDAESGLHYNYYRDGYEPRTGRYSQTDPIGLAGGLNTYAYAGNDPISQIDPLGLANGPAVGWMHGPYAPGPTTFQITTHGVCDGQGPECTMAMQAAGIQGPYHGQTKIYDLACVAGLGLVGKVGAAKVGNEIAKQIPKGAAALGAGPRTMSAITRGVGVYTHPATTAVALSLAVPAVLEHCEVKPSCESGLK